DVLELRNQYYDLNAAVADAALGMIQRQNEDARIGDRERAFDQIHVLARAGKLRHVDREVRVCHHARKGVHHEVRVAPAGKIEGEVITRIVERPKKRDTLDVIQMKVAEKNVSADRFIAEFLLELVSEITNAGSAVENQNLIRVGSDF